MIRDKVFLGRHFLLAFLFLFLSSIGAPPSSQAQTEQIHAEHIHDHTTLHSGQVGMSGDFHIEFTAHKDGEYKLYVTDFLRKQVDISKGSGTLIINSDGAEPEELTLAVDQVLQEFLVAHGKPRLEGETIVASARIRIPGKEPIFIEFVERIGTSGNKKDGHEGHRH